MWLIWYFTLIWLVYTLVSWTYVVSNFICIFLFQVTSSIQIFILSLFLTWVKHFIDMLPMTWSNNTQIFQILLLLFHILKIFHSSTTICQILIVLGEKLYLVFCYLREVYLVIVFWIKLFGLNLFREVLGVMLFLIRI